MARLHDVVFDCRHPASIARFWAAALDGYEVAPYDEAELARLRANGIFDTEDDPTVLVEAPGTSPRIFFQLVPEHKTVKNRVHLDLKCDSVPVRRHGCRGSARAWWRSTTIAWFSATRKATSSVFPLRNEFCLSPEG